MVKHSFVFGPKATHRVAESEHGPHSSEGLVCVVFDMLLVLEPPARFTARRGTPRIIARQLTSALNCHRFM
jgi:hypothetical protein